MKKFINLITNNNPAALRKPVLLEIFQSMLQGQPYFIIMLVLIEFLRPLISGVDSFDIFRIGGLCGWLALAMILLFIVGRYTYLHENCRAYSMSSEGRLHLGDYLRRLSMGFYKGRDPGDITTLMLQDYTNIEIMTSHMLMDAIGSLALPVIFLIFLIPIDWRMSLIAVSMIPLSFMVAIVAGKFVSWMGNRQMSSKNEASSRMLEYLDGMKNIKSYNLQGEKFSRLDKAFRLLMRNSIKLEAASGPLILFGAGFLQAGTAIIMVTGVFFVIQGSLSVTDFLFFLIVGTRMYDPLMKVMINYAELSYYSLSVKRICEIYDTKPLEEPDEAVSSSGNDIEFSDVTFHYHEKDVLKDVSFHLKENTMTALVGSSGAGKSTVTRLIARFWDVNNGEIRIGGNRISDYSQEDLMSKISMVFQDVYLFNDTLYNNIQVGKQDASNDEIIAAAKKARCHDFIMSLPQGYDTMVGESGATLSGGEKQRISIARAVLKDAPIVLLDEATASLDPENELYIQQAIDDLIKGRTIIVIAHRLSTITHANNIIVLKDGMIAESGTHDSLINIPGGVYSGMWEEQKKAHQWKISTREA